MSEEAIKVRGARVNNLKNVSFSIPIEKMTVVTGVSGSGKSSLAFDTIYAEGQRRYVESLSAYARQFLERMDKPDVDEVLGIPPAIAIRQKNSTRNPRSTVGTQTEVYDYLRLLYARVGTTICRVCGREVNKDSPESAAQETLGALAEGARFYVLFPAEAGLRVEMNGNGKAATKRKKSSKAQGPTAATDRRTVTAHVMSLMQRGFTRLFAGGEIIELRSPDDFARANFEGVYVLVDRLVARADVRERLVDSFETCFTEGHGQAFVQTVGEEARALKFSERFECKYDGTVYAQPEPRLFSFNNPYGACPTCQGFGNTIGLDLDLVIPNPQLSLGDGAVEPWTKPQYDWARTELRSFARQEKIPLDAPFQELSEQQRRALVEGKTGFGGVRGFFDWLETKKYKLHVRVFL
ncbi:MAG: excinuclease ABC subunit A, partial [Rubrivivax sp.]|nr:excinuclease ABC subunit A [Pyrinomonadaceae bacterium]